MSAAAEFEVDVLVAGAGPVGLMAALQLARAGISVRVVDRASGPATTSRALGAHARSMEIYDQLGILADIVSGGTRVNAFIRQEGDRSNRLDFRFGDLATAYGFMLNVDQVIIERVLRGHLAMHQVAIEWGTALSSFTCDAQGVTCELTTARADEQAGDEGADHETVRARYLWGCDGGHSTVRKLLELPLEGAPAHTWLIADAVVDTDLAGDGVHWLFPGGGALMLFPFPEARKWRLLDTTGEGDADRPDQIAEQFATKLSRAVGREITVERPTWVSKFTIQQRAVPSMHVGRCFVSGDAAHVHSPASGQGLNTGVQDAYNLGWKLAMVIRGEAEAELLETYDAERVPVGQALLASTSEIMGTVMVDTDSAEEGAGADSGAEDSGGTQANPAVPGPSGEALLDFQGALIRSMSGLGIAYPDSPLTVGDAVASAGPQPGQRLTQMSAADAQSPGWTLLREELRSPGWHLVTFAGPADAGDSAAMGEPVESSAGRESAMSTTGLPGWLQQVSVSRRRPVDRSTVWDPDGRVHDTLGGSAGDWILVRPDGYLAARGTGGSSLDEALQQLQTNAGIRLEGVSA